MYDLKGCADPMQAKGCQFIGEWAQGVFVSGTWALQDGSLYRGAFGNKVKFTHE